MDGLLLVSYLLSWGMSIAAAWRMMHVLLPQRATRLNVAVLSFVGYYIVGAALFLLFNIPFVSMVGTFSILFVLTFNFKVTTLRRLVTAVTIFFINIAVEIVFTIINGLGFSMFEDAGITEGDAAIVWSLLGIGMATYLMAMVLSRFKNIKKDTPMPVAYWLSSLGIPFVSLFLLHWVVFYFPLSIAVGAAAIIFAINIFAIYLRDVISTAYESKLDIITLDKQRMHIMMDASPLACVILDRELKVLDANKRIISMFGLSDVGGYMRDPLKHSPQYQPDGRQSQEKAMELMRVALDDGYNHSEWMHKTATGEPLPCELTAVKLPEQDAAIIYIHDLREVRGLVTMKDHMERLAFTDELTQLFNRRYFMEAAQRDLENCYKHRQPFSVLMLDIDYFKRVNDTYGHAFGDEVLKIFAERVKSVLRQGTVAARYGGEEFVLAMPSADSDGAYKTAKRILSAVSEEPFVVNDVSLDVTVSIGIATTTSGAELPLAGIIAQADTALYTAKNEGRNRVRPEATDISN
jgi:diguanylate cyclase (GGDEF)-like protein